MYDFTKEKRDEERLRKFQEHTDSITFNLDAKFYLVLNPLPSPLCCTSSNQPKDTGSTVSQIASEA